MRPHVSLKASLLSGCDSGFGRAAAFALADAGFIVCAGCLRPDQCEDLKTNSKIHVLDLDVSDEHKVKACAEFVEKLCGGKGLVSLL